MKLEDVTLAEILAKKFEPMTDVECIGFAGAEGDMFSADCDEFFAVMDVTPGKIVIQLMDTECGDFRTWTLNPESDY